ncbi:MerR family DNA-binding transcriptional regulator [Acinetobacter sp. WCHAc060025]|uniref:helix-turn-helix domain-containing protein n=1 Tax=Acinetobacter sp. WCHAc060025 TaxID=2518625 RepID=UPI002B05CB53|nr:MerR family DNA-binding transcriptional regulator [Acinetobacter sp. WCHAc060025]
MNKLNLELLLLISDIAKKTGLSIHTLRYYEQIGLLKIFIVIKQIDVFIPNWTWTG